MKLHTLLTCFVWQKECKIRWKEMKKIVAARSNSSVTKAGWSQSHLHSHCADPQKSWDPIGSMVQRQTWVWKNLSHFFPMFLKKWQISPFCGEGKEKWNNPLKAELSYQEIDVMHRNTWAILEWVLNYAKCCTLSKKTDQLVVLLPENV